MLRGLLPLVSGALFSVGLIVGGMTQPAKVVAFLDFAGDWDPSLAFVMAGAIGAYLPLSRWILRARRQPLHSLHFSIPTRRDLDPKLLGGAALFGIGWGLAGYCPGPAFASLGALAPTALLFVPAMLIGMALHRLLPAAR